MTIQIILISILSFVMSCSDETTPEQESLFIGQWDIVSSPDDFIYFYYAQGLSFKMNGVVSPLSINNNNVIEGKIKGKWSYQEKTNSLTILNEEGVGDTYKIEIKSKEQFEIIVKEGETYLFSKIKS